MPEEWEHLEDLEEYIVLLRDLAQAWQSRGEDPHGVSSAVLRFRAAGFPLPWDDGHAGAPFPGGDAEGSGSRLSIDA